jgi:DNA-binding NtrC family response regulator
VGAWEDPVKASDATSVDVPEKGGEALPPNPAVGGARPAQFTNLSAGCRSTLESRGIAGCLALARSGAADVPTVEPRGRQMRQVHARLRSVGISPRTPVLLEGPLGAGRHYAARMLRRLTWASDPEAPFVEVDCASRPGFWGSRTPRS